MSTPGTEILMWKSEMHTHVAEALLSMLETEVLMWWQTKTLMWQTDVLMWQTEITKYFGDSHEHFGSSLCRPVPLPNTNQPCRKPQQLTVFDSIFEMDPSYNHSSLCLFVDQWYCERAVRPPIQYRAMFFLLLPTSSQLNFFHLSSSMFRVMPRTNMGGTWKRWDSTWRPSTITTNCTCAVPTRE